MKSTDTVVPGKMLMAIGGLVDLGKKLKDKLKHLESQNSPPNGTSNGGGSNSGSSDGEGIKDVKPRLKLVLSVSPVRLGCID